MGWCVSVKSDFLPEVNEPVHSFSSCRGNIVMATKDLGLEPLSKISDPKEAMLALKNLILELDKNDNGIFNNDYFIIADEQWSKKRESLSAWNKVSSLKNINPNSNLPEYYNSYEEYTGYTCRERLRKDAVRFFLYYKAGYDVSFEW